MMFTEPVYTVDEADTDIGRSTYFMRAHNSRSTPSAVNTSDCFR